MLCCVQRLHFHVPGVALKEHHCWRCKTETRWPNHCGDFLKRAIGWIMACDNFHMCVFPNANPRPPAALGEGGDSAGQSVFLWLSVPGSPQHQQPVCSCVAPLGSRAAPPTTWVSEELCSIDQSSSLFRKHTLCDRNVGQPPQSCKSHSTEKERWLRSLPSRYSIALKKKCFWKLNYFWAIRHMPLF